MSQHIEAKKITMLLLLPSHKYNVECFITLGTAVPEKENKHAIGGVITFIQWKNNTYFKRASISGCIEGFAPGLASATARR